MHSGTVSGKSFEMFTLNQGLLARCVDAVKEGDSLARKTGQIQSFEVFRNGFRMNLVIGRIMVIPPAVCESKEDFPVAMLYGALVREIRPEDLADLMAAKIGDTEFDEYSEADMQEIKEKLFQVPGTKKYASLVLFLPSWSSPREYVMFKYTKDDNALANALRHLVFSAYFDPRLSSAFDHIMQDTDTVNHGTELDVTNITPKLNYPGIAEGARNEYPDLQSADDAAASQDRPTGPGSKKKKASGPVRKIALSLKWADEIKADELERGEVDVISAVTEAAEAAVLKKRENVSDVAADDNAAKHASAPKKAGQVPCPYCRHSEPSAEDVEDHIERAHKNKKAQLGHKIMPGCQHEGNHSSCPGVVDGVHCDCECHEKAEQEGLIGTTKSGKKAGEVNGLGEMKVKMKLNLDELPEKAQEKVVEGATGAAKNMGDAKTANETKIFDTSTVEGLKAAERYKARLENKYDRVTTTPAGLNRVKIEGVSGQTASKTAAQQCECGDPGCPMHPGQESCKLPAVAILYRVDMEDQTGTAMCEECTVDAMDSGLFRVEEIPVEAEPMLAADKTADTADNAANEKGGEGAIEVKTDADIKNTRGTEPTLAPDKNASGVRGGGRYLDGKLVAGGHKPGCDCGFCKNKGNLPGTKKEEKDEKDKKEASKTAKTASRGGFPHHMTDGRLPNDYDDAMVISVMHQLEVPRRFNQAGITASAENVAESRRTADARQDHENRIAKLRRTVVADESDDIFAEVTESMGKPPQVKVKDGDGRPDGATPKLADAGAMDWFITDRDFQGQPKENVPEELVIPESEPVTGVYNNDQEGKDPVGKALQSAPDVKAPADLGESKATDVKEPLDLNEAASRWLGDESVENDTPDVETHQEEGHQVENEAPKQASRPDRIIATLDDLIDSEPFDPVNEERPDSSLLEGLVSGPIPGGRHETNDTAGPANKVADAPVGDSETEALKGICPRCGGHRTSLNKPYLYCKDCGQVTWTLGMNKKGGKVAEFDNGNLKSDAEVIPNKTEPAKLDNIQLGGPQNTSERPNVDAVREQVETSQEMDKHETIEEKEAEVEALATKEIEELKPEAAAEEEGATEVVNAPAGSGKIVININAAKWLKAHGLFDADDAEPITSGQGGGGQQSTAGPVGAEGMPNLEASIDGDDLAAIASKTAGPLAQEQQSFFTDAVHNIEPHVNLPSGIGEGAEGGGAEALGDLALVAGKTAERGLPPVTSPSKDYNGWHNWETWHVALLIDNEEPLYKAKQNLARAVIKKAPGGAFNQADVNRLADQMSKVLRKAYVDTKNFYESNAREMPDSNWATEPFEEVNWHEIAENALFDVRADMYAATNEPEAPTASVEKEATTEKEAGFNFFFPGQVLREFYPEVQHEIVDYPNADNKPMIQDVDLEPAKMGSVQKEAFQPVRPPYGDVHRLEDMPPTGEIEGWESGVSARPKPLEDRLRMQREQEMEMVSSKEACGCDEVHAVENAVKPIEDKKKELKEEMGIKEAGSPNYVSTDPGAIGIGRDGKPQVLEGAPLRKENDIRGPMFSEEFYAASPAIPGAALRMASVAKLTRDEFRKKAAATADQKEMLADFLKKVMGEIAVTFVAAFKVTSRPVDLDKIPGTGEVNLVSVENSVNNWPFYAGEVGGRVKFLLEQMNDSDIQDAINDAWSQAAVWHDGSGSGNFTYEVFVRAEAIDTDNMVLKYKFVTGTKGA